MRADRGIATPKDLEGKTVGIPEWAQTAGIYARGYLAETAGVDLAKIKWVQAGVNQAGREEKVEFKLPPGIQYQQRRDTSLGAMLMSGEIDAAISARAPDAFATAAARSCGCFRIIAARRWPITRRPASIRSCMSSPCAAPCSSAILGWR